MFAKSTSARCLLLLSALAIAHGVLPPEAFIQSVKDRILQSPHLKQLAPKRSLEAITVHQAKSAADQKLFDDFPSNPDGKNALACTGNLYVAVCPAASGDLEPIDVPVRAIKANKTNPAEAGPIFFALQFKDGTVEQPPRVPPSPAVIDADMKKIAEEAEKKDSELRKLTDGRSITHVEFVLNLKPLHKSEGNLEEARSYVVMTDEDVIEACVYNAGAPSSNSDKAGQDSTEDDGLKLKVRRLAGQKSAFDGASYKTPFVVMTIVAAVLIILVVVLLVSRDSSSEASSKQNNYV